MYKYYLNDGTYFVKAATSSSLFMELTTEDLTGFSCVWNDIEGDRCATGGVVGCKMLGLSTPCGLPTDVQSIE